MPLPHAPAEPSSAPPTVRRVLLVEDNEATSKGLARLLQIRGFSVTTALNGTSALEALERGHPPDFVLTDLQLPDLDGRDIARHVSTLTPRPRVGLITGWDLDCTPEQREAYGIDWILYKPLDVRELIRRLNEDQGTPGL